VKYVSPQQLSDADLHPDAILGMARQFFESRNPVVVSDPAGSLQTIAAGFALMPYLQTACELLMPFIDQSVWQRSYCPVCGGKPVFASLARESGTRCLLCSRCTGIWQYGRVGCPFCEAAEDLIYYPSDDGRYRLYVCDTCKRYLKTIDLRESEQEVYLPVECIVTVAMDIAAQDKGYRHY
jgi:FdhE protein